MVIKLILIFELTDILKLMFFFIVKCQYTVKYQYVRF